MDYAVCFLFSQDLTEVLLQRKISSGHDSKYNGISKLLSSCEEPINSIGQEVSNVIGYSLPIVPVCTITRESLYLDSRGMRHTLYFFAGIVDKRSLRELVNDSEELHWQDVDWVLCTPADSAVLTGEGDVQYAVRLATKMLGI